MMEEDLVGFLRANARVATLTGRGGVYHAGLPQGAAIPAVIVHVFHNAAEYDDRGPLGLASALAQIDCWADKAVVARDLARSVEGALSGFSGMRGATDFRYIYFDGSRDDREGGTNAAQYRFRRSLDFTVWYSQAEKEISDGEDRT